ncbi:MAG: sulfatase [Armatimonadetes bacterium]|nr:sulfatase [Armatimonadota bacterium]
MKKHPNLLLIAIDSLRRDHMSLHGYHRLTTPHIDSYSELGTVFAKCFSPHIPTTPAYSSMLTGMDAFGTDVVALRHEGPLGSHVRTMPEVLEEQGYNTVCVGFSGNPASRGFQKYLDFSGWGSFNAGRSPKAENLNEVALPELRRLAGEDKPFFLFLRHMDPHSPYLPPRPFERMFYAGDECDPDNRSLDPVYAFKPFADYLSSWFPPGCTDAEYIIAQYDGAVAYMDACIQNIFAELEALGIEEETLVVINADHGETLYDHDCYFDHHGLYEPTLVVPLIFRFPGRVPEALWFEDYCSHKDLMPTVMELLKLKTKIRFDGRSLVPLMRGDERKVETEFYLTEATWMRKHGWRTPEWKLIRALEPDLHFKPPVELYNLIKDPDENCNVADQNPEIVNALTQRMEAHIAAREKQTGRTNPVFTNLNWHGQGTGPFQSSEQAYESLYIGSPSAAQNLQQKEKEKVMTELQRQRGAKKL